MEKWPEDYECDGQLSLFETRRDMLDFGYYNMDCMGMVCKR